MRWALLLALVWGCKNKDDEPEPDGVGTWDDAPGDFDDGDFDAPDVTTVEHCFDDVDNDGDGKVDCADVDCDFEHACIQCPVQVSGTCGTNYAPFSTAPRQGLANYGCNPGAGGTAEIIYEFLSLEDRDVGVRVTPPGGFGATNVDLYVLEGACHPDTCIGYSAVGGGGGTEQVMFEAKANVWYWFVLERISGNETQFDLEVLCN